MTRQDFVDKWSRAATPDVYGSTRAEEKARAEIAAEMDADMRSVLIDQAKRRKRKTIGLRAAVEGA